jgi:hypothetical protein
MKYEAEIMEWAADGMKLVKAWVDENDAQLALFDNGDGTFDLIRAFELGFGSNVKVAVSVDRRNFKPRMPVMPKLPTEAEMALTECVSGSWRDIDIEG